MSLGSVLKGPRFHRMESVKSMQYRSNLQYSVYLLYIFFLAGLSVSSVSVTLAVAVAVAVAVDVGAAAVGWPYFVIASVANREATKIQATWVV